MANVFNPVTDQSKVSGIEYGSMDTTGASFGITTRGAKLVDLAINIGSGDTVVLEGEYRSGVANAAEWLAIETFTADAVKVIRVGAARRLRMNMTVAAATTTYELAAGNRE